MTKTSKTIVFFGSGPVAAKSLSLLQDSFEIEAVITKPTTTIEMEEALHQPAPVLSVANSKQLETIVATNDFKSSAGLLIDFGIIISREVIAMFELGIINSHFSILPEWRGADPISFSILSGQDSTGVSLMKLVPAMDEGPLLAYQEFVIPEKFTTPQLTDALIALSNELLINHLPPYLTGIQEANIPQDTTHKAVSYSRKLTKADGILNFNTPAAQLEAQIRAFIDWPKSHTSIVGKEVIITQASILGSNTLQVGEVAKTNDKKIIIGTAKGALAIELLKPAGKQVMSAEAFIAGYGKVLPLLS